ncbi:hypothetical protein MNBD_PLANCTO02-1885, partial [hydrothermal vent metagenome]
MATKNGNAEFKKLLQSIKARLRGDVDQLTQ